MTPTEIIDAAQRRDYLEAWLPRRQAAIEQMADGPERNLSALDWTTLLHEYERLDAQLGAQPQQSFSLVGLRDQARQLAERRGGRR